MFEIDFKRLVALLLPMSLRRPLIFGVLRAGVSGVERGYKDFMAVRKEHNFRLTHNGQVCYLRGALNYYFGPGFKIGNIRQEGDWLYAVTETGENITLAVTEEGKGVPMLYSEQMLNAAQNDFVVFVPGIYWVRLEEIKAMVDRYKLVTKRAHYIKTNSQYSVNQGLEVVTTWSPNVFNQLTATKQ